MEDERKKPWRPPVKLAVCSKCGAPVSETSVRSCRHPAVRAAHGENNKICLYCCKRKPCPFSRKDEYAGLWSCTYKERSQ